MITMSRKIYIIGEINSEAYLKFTRKLGRLEDLSHDQVHIVLSSNGGDAQVALAFYDRIRLSRCPISITGTGLVASAAALIMVAPKDVSLRTMTSSSWLMVHDEVFDGTEIANLRTASAARYLTQMNDFENQWNNLMASSTNADATTWGELHRVESYLGVDQCLSLGVIGSIL